MNNYTNQCWLQNTDNKKKISLPGMKNKTKTKKQQQQKEQTQIALPLIPPPPPPTWRRRRKFAENSFWNFQGLQTCIFYG